MSRQYIPPKRPDIVEWAKKMAAAEKEFLETGDDKAAIRNLYAREKLFESDPLQFECKKCKRLIEYIPDPEDLSGPEKLITYNKRRTCDRCEREAARG